MTSALQAYINTCAASGTVAELDNGVFFTSSPLVVPSQTTIRGQDPGGGFVTMLRPRGCRAFVFTNSYHSAVSNLTIWPDGPLPAPDCYLYFANTYSHAVRDIRLHIGAGQAPCSKAPIIAEHVGGPNNNLVLSNVVTRSDGAYYPAGYLFGPGCGTVQVMTPDLETCGVGIDWRGGKITVVAPYTERLGQACIRASIAEPTVGTAQLSVHGGLLASTHSGIAFQIYNGVRNLSCHGVFIDSSLAAREGFFYTDDTTTGVSFYGCVTNAAKWNRQPTII